MTSVNIGVDAIKVVFTINKAIELISLELEQCCLIYINRYIGYSCVLAGLYYGLVLFGLGRNIICKVLYLRVLKIKQK